MVHRGYSEMTTITMATPYRVIAIVAALALFGVVALTVAVTIPVQMQQAEAAAGGGGCVNGTKPFFRSQGSCFHP